MWADATRLRALANLLFGLSAVWLLGSGLSYAVHLPVFALRAVELTAAPTHATAEELRLVVAQVQGNFFTADLQRTRQALEQLPWVRSASVRRKFPWALQVELEEQVALARWNQGDLVNTYGEVFHAETDERLPVFLGEAHHSHQVAEAYVEMTRQLQPLQRQITRVVLSPRLAWQIELDDGLQLALGREAMGERLARFVRVYPSILADMPGRPRHGGAEPFASKLVPADVSGLRRVDLRYRDGFAVANG